MKTVLLKVMAVILYIPFAVPGSSATISSEHVSVQQKQLSAALTDIGFGYLSSKKPADTLCIVGENVNSSLSLYDKEKHWKVDWLQALSSWYQSDGLLMQCKNVALTFDSFLNHYPHQPIAGRPGL